MASFPGNLGGRHVEWCPDGGGYHAYCPQPTDPDDYTNCCTYFYLLSSKPSCCRYPIHSGLLITCSLAAIFLFLLLLFLYCWFWPRSWMNKRRQANREIVSIYQPYDSVHRPSYVK